MQRGPLRDIVTHNVLCANARACVCVLSLCVCVCAVCLVCITTYAIIILRIHIRPIFERHIDHMDMSCCCCLVQDRPLYIINTDPTALHRLLPLALRQCITTESKEEKELLLGTTYSAGVLQWD